MKSASSKKSGKTPVAKIKDLSKSTTKKSEASSEADERRLRKLKVFLKSISYNGSEGMQFESLNDLYGESLLLDRPPCTGLLTLGEFRCNPTPFLVASCFNRTQVPGTKGRAMGSTKRAPRRPPSNGTRRSKKAQQVYSTASQASTPREIYAMQQNRLVKSKEKQTAERLGVRSDRGGISGVRGKFGKESKVTENQQAIPKGIPAPVKQKTQEQHTDIQSEVSGVRGKTVRESKQMPESKQETLAQKTSGIHENKKEIISKEISTGVVQITNEQDREVESDEPVRTIGKISCGERGIHKPDQDLSVTVDELNTLAKDTNQQIKTKEISEEQNHDSKKKDTVVTSTDNLEFGKQDQDAGGIIKSAKIESEKVESGKMESEKMESEKMESKKVESEKALGCKDSTENEEIDDDKNVKHLLVLKERRFKTNLDERDTSNEKLSVKVNDKPETEPTDTNVKHKVESREIHNEPSKPTDKNHEASESKTSGKVAVSTSTLNSKTKEKTCQFTLVHPCESKGDTMGEKGETSDVNKADSSSSAVTARTSCTKDREDSPTTSPHLRSSTTKSNDATNTTSPDTRTTKQHTLSPIARKQELRAVPESSSLRSEDDGSLDDNKDVGHHYNIRKKQNKTNTL